MKTPRRLPAQKPERAESSTNASPFVSLPESTFFMENTSAGDFSDFLPQLHAESYINTSQRFYNEKNAYKHMRVTLQLYKAHTPSLSQAHVMIRPCSIICENGIVDV